MLCIWRKLGFGALPLLCKSCALLLFKIQTWEERSEEDHRCSEGKLKGVREVRVWCFVSALQVLCASSSLQHKNMGRGRGRERQLQRREVKGSAGS